MSDSEPDFDDPRFLVDVPETSNDHELTYHDRRKRKLIESERKGRTKSRVQLEQEQREIGLSENLVENAHEDNKALNMMKAMGFKPGDSLGKRPENPPRFSSSGFSRVATSAAEPSPAPASSNAPINEPIKFQIRTGRTGLGVPQRAPPKVVPSSRGSDSRGGETTMIDSTPLPDLPEFLAHVRATIDSKRAFGILKSCRRTLEELDRRHGVDEGDNVMWYDPDEVERDAREHRNKALFARLDKELESSGDEGDAERSEADRDKRREKSELDYLRGRSDTVVDDDEEDESPEVQVTGKDGGARDGATANSADRESKRQERDEWLALDVATRLALTMSYLRHHYHYCFYCGCQYDDAKDLEDNCPGTEEEDH